MVERDTSDEEDKTTPFWSTETSLQALAVQQGVSPVTDLDRLRGEFWPDGENADDFLAALREWRQEGGGQGRGE